MFPMVNTAHVWFQSNRFHFHQTNLHRNSNDKHTYAHKLEVMYCWWSSPWAFTKIQEWNRNQNPTCDSKTTRFWRLITEKQIIHSNSGDVSNDCLRTILLLFRSNKIIKQQWPINVTYKSYIKESDQFHWFRFRFDVNGPLENPFVRGFNGNWSRQLHLNKHEKCFCNSWWIF